MATRHFDNASLGTVPESFLPFSLLMRGYATPLRLIRPRQSEKAGREQLPAPTVAESGDIGRCLRWAFAIEGGAAAAICAIWVLCRVFWQAICSGRQPKKFQPQCSRTQLTSCGFLMVARFLRANHRLPLSMLFNV